MSRGVGFERVGWGDGRHGRRERRAGGRAGGRRRVEWGPMAAPPVAGPFQPCRDLRASVSCWRARTHALHPLVGRGGVVLMMQLR